MAFIAFRFSVETKKRAKLASGLSIAGILMALYEIIPTSIPSLGIEQLSNTLPVKWLVIVPGTYFVAMFLLSAYSDRTEQYYSEAPSKARNIVLSLRRDRDAYVNILKSTSALIEDERIPPSVLEGMMDNIAGPCLERYFHDQSSSDDVAFFANVIWYNMRANFDRRMDKTRWVIEAIVPVLLYIAMLVAFFVK